jgi:light-regulated signal transduction histidine kinase (bacteriophytochrome)
MAMPCERNNGTGLEKLASPRHAQPHLSVKEPAQRELGRVRRESEELAWAASHDLREPLRMINIYTQLLVRKYEATFDDQAREFAHRIQESASRMENLIQGVTQYSGGMEQHGLSLSPVPLRIPVQKALSRFEGQLGKIGATVEVGRLPTVAGDQGQFEIVFHNLLSNSLKYAHPNRALHVRIWARRCDGKCLVCFSDNGIGFKPEFSQRIFGLFRRLHGREVPGTGLGLAVCRQIVERYGGRIYAEGHPDKGATFILKLKGFTRKGFSRHAARTADPLGGGQSRRRISFSRSSEQKFYRA